MNNARKRGLIKRSHRKRPLHRKRFSYNAMRRAAEIGASHGYYFAYMTLGLKEGEPIDVAALYKMASESVQQQITQIEGVGFIRKPEGTIRIDVLNEIVEIADRSLNMLATGMRLPSPNKGKKKDGTLRAAVEKLIAADSGISRETIEEKTKNIKTNGKIRNPVKHKRAIYDVLRKIAPNLL